MITEYDFEECLQKIGTPAKLPKKKYLEKGRFPVVAQEEALINGYTNDENLLYKVEDTLIIFGDHTRHLKLIDFDFVLGADGAKLLKTIEEIDTKYFYYYLRAKMPDSLGYARHYRLLKQLRFLIPSLQVQKQIVEKLDTAFADIDKAISATEKNIENAEALFEQYVDMVFQTHSKDLETKALGDVTHTITKGSSPKWQGINYVPEPGTLFVTSENVRARTLNLDKTKYVEDKFNEKDKKSLLKYGDVLTNIVGASIGRTALFDRHEKANINQAVCLIRCIDSYLNSTFLVNLLNSPTYRKMLHQNETNMARANLSLTFFSQLNIPVPNLSQQEKINRLINEFQCNQTNLHNAYNNKKKLLTALKSSILNQAFSGELTKDAA